MLMSMHVKMYITFLTNSVFFTDHITSLSGALEREKEVRQKLEKEVGQLALLQADLAKEKKEKEKLEECTKQLQQKIVELEERVKKQQEDINNRGMLLFYSGNSIEI